MSGGGQMYQILQCLADVSSIWETGSAIADQITGDGQVQQTLQSLQNMTAELVAAMDNVANQIQDLNLQEQWTPVSKVLNNAQASAVLYAGQFATLTANNKVSVASTSYTFQQWCEGVPTANPPLPPAIGDMATQIQNIYELFITGGVANPAVLNLWNELCSAASAIGTAGFVNQTNYNMQYQLQQEIYQIVCALYYTRETALAYYYSVVPSNNGDFEPLAAQISSQMGSVLTPNTVWGAFHAQMLSYQNGSAGNPLTPTQAAGQCALTNDANPSPNSAPTLDYGNYGCTFFDMSLTSIKDNPQLGVACFGNIQIAVAQYNSDMAGDYQYAYLIGTPVQILANLALAPGTPMTACPNYSSPSQIFENCVPVCTGSNAVPRGSPYAYLVNSYVVGAGAPIAFANMLVVTGFQFYPVGNTVVIQLTYGTLDLSDPANPSITPVEDRFAPDPTNYTFFAVDGWDRWSTNIGAIDTRAVGTADCFPLTNVTVQQTSPTGDGTGPGTCIGLNAQSACPFYRLDSLQPALALAPFSPSMPSQPLQPTR